MITPELDPALAWAKNAPGSVTTIDFDRTLELNHHLKENFWDGYMFNMIRYHGLMTVKNDIALCDLGCGSGTITSKIAQYARQVMGYRVHASVIDLLPINVYQTKNRLLSIGVQGADYMIGDVTKKFPSGLFDFITAFDLIHWFSPQQIDGLFANVRNHLHKGGQFVVKYATELNNALLRDQKGELNINRNCGERPLYKYSYPTKTWMTFPDVKWLSELGKRHNLRPSYYLETDTPFFPTRRPLNIPIMSERFVSTEVAYMGFGAT